MPNSFSECILHLQKKLTRRGINYSLDRLNLALNTLGNPEKSLPTTIHIAGTNGKGSVAHYINQLLINNNYSVLSYTSPHISSYTERIKVNGHSIDEQLFCNLFYEVNQSDVDDVLSEYEILTLMALLFAHKSSIDYLILETGLGGRLDATNVVPKSIAVITDIGFDHCDILGDTITSIASEKAGIIKSQSSVITHFDQDPTAKKVILNVAKNKDSSIHLTPHNSYQTYHERNKALAKQTCRHILKSCSPNIDKFIDNLMPPFGRMTPSEYLGIPCTFDVGHNLNALDAILSSYSTSSTWIIGMQQTKDYIAIINRLMDQNKTIYLCNFSSSISVSIDQIPCPLNQRISVWKIGDAISKDTIFFGSFYFIEALESFKKSIKLTL